MGALRIIGSVILALIVFRVAYALFGPPGALVAAVALGGWWTLRASGVSVIGVVRSLFKRGPPP